MVLQLTLCTAAVVVAGPADDAIVGSAGARGLRFGTLHSFGQGSPRKSG